LLEDTIEQTASIVKGRGETEETARQEVFERISERIVERLSQGEL
jgi:hypothetical protein